MIHTTYKLKCECGKVNTLRLPSEWISVEERPAEPNVWMIVWDSLAETWVGAIWNERYWMTRDGLRLCSVTHYMPGPSAPEEREPC